MTERPPSEAARSDPALEGRDAAEARMAPPHLVLLNGVAKETSRAAPAEPPVIELGARGGGPGGGPAGGGGAARDLKGRDAAAAEARHRVPTTELCRPPGPAPASAPAELPGDGRMVQLSPPALAAPAAPGRALLYSLSQPLASLGRSGPAGGAGGQEAWAPGLPFRTSGAGCPPPGGAVRLSARREGERGTFYTRGRKSLAGDPVQVRNEPSASVCVCVRTRGAMCRCLVNAACWELGSRRGGVPARGWL